MHIRPPVISQDVQHGGGDVRAQKLEQENQSLKQRLQSVEEVSGLATAWLDKPLVNISLLESMSPCFKAKDLSWKAIANTWKMSRTRCSAWFFLNMPFAISAVTSKGCV